MIRDHGYFSARINRGARIHREHVSRIQILRYNFSETLISLREFSIREITTN